MRIKNVKILITFLVCVSAQTAHGQVVSRFYRALSSSLNPSQSCSTSVLDTIAGNQGHTCNPTNFVRALCSEDDPPAPGEEPTPQGSALTAQNDREVENTIGRYVRGAADKCGNPTFMAAFPQSQSLALLCAAHRALTTLDNPNSTDQAHREAALVYAQHSAQLRAFATNPPATADAIDAAILNGGSLNYAENTDPMIFPSPLRAMLQNTTQQSTARAPGNYSQKALEFSNSIGDRLKASYNDELEAQYRATLNKIDPNNAQQFHFARASFNALKNRIRDVRINYNPGLAERTCLGNQRNVIYLPKNGRPYDINDSESISDQVVICPGALADLSEEALAGLVARAMAGAIDACSMDRTWVAPLRNDRGNDQSDEESAALSPMERRLPEDALFLHSLQEEQRVCLVRQSSNPPLSTDEARRGSRGYTRAFRPNENIANRTPGPHCPPNLTQADLQNRTFAALETGRVAATPPQDQSNATLAESWAAKAVARWSYDRHNGVFDATERRRLIMRDLRQTYKPICDRESDLRESLGYVGDVNQVDPSIRGAIESRNQRILSYIADQPFPPSQKLLTNVIAQDERVRAVLGCTAPLPNNRCSPSSNIATGIRDYMSNPNGFYADLQATSLEFSGETRQSAIDRGLEQMTAECETLNTDAEEDLGNQCGSSQDQILIDTSPTVSGAAESGRTISAFGQQVRIGCQSFCSCSDRSCIARPVYLGNPAADRARALGRGRGLGPDYIARLAREDRRNLTRGGTNSVADRACALDLPDPATVFAGASAQTTELPEIRKSMDFYGELSGAQVKFICVHRCSRPPAGGSGDIECSASIENDNEEPDPGRRRVQRERVFGGQPPLLRINLSNIGPARVLGVTRAPAGRPEAPDTTPPPAPARTPEQIAQENAEYQFRATAEAEIGRQRRLTFDNGDNVIARAHGIHRTRAGGHTGDGGYRLVVLDHYGDFRFIENDLDNNNFLVSSNPLVEQERDSIRQELSAREGREHFETPRNTAVIGGEAFGSVHKVRVVGGRVVVEHFIEGQLHNSSSALDDPNISIDLVGGGSVRNPESGRNESFSRAQLLQENGNLVLYYVTTERNQQVVRRVDWEEAAGEWFNFTAPPAPRSTTTPVSRETERQRLDRLWEWPDPLHGPPGTDPLAPPEPPRPRRGHDDRRHRQRLGVPEEPRAWHN